MSIPAARYFVANKGMPLVPSAPGKPLIVPINPMVSEAWNLLNAPPAVAAQFPGKECFILRTDTSNLYLSTMLFAAPDGEAQSDIVLLPVDATTTPDENQAWAFVLEGPCSINRDSFSGKIVSINGRYTFGVRPPTDGRIGVLGTPFMSPDPEVPNADWTLHLALLSDVNDGA